VIRPATPEDLPRLQQIERAAGGPFRDLGMARVADDEPPSVDELTTYQRDGRVWVATDDGADDDRAVGYLLVDVVDAAAHIEQVSVDPAYAHRGLGRELIDTAAAWAARQGLEALTLTTFTDVPWNGPYYARLGFTVVPDDEAGPGLLALRSHERAIGLDAWPRQSMRRPLTT
jgi:ribosomal protein S18 acetylase RimI-like enzyme